MTQKKQQRKIDSARDPFVNGTNLDLSGFPQFQESLENADGSDLWLGPDTHLVEENRHSLKQEILRLANAQDGEVSEHLKRANIEDPMSPKTFYIGADKVTAHLGKDNLWRATRYSGGTQETVNFPDAKTREDVQVQATRYFARNTIRIRKLTDSEELYIIRLCQLGKLEDAIQNYLAYRVGDISDNIAGTVAEEPKYLSVANECVWFVFEHSTPTFAEEARVFMEQYLANRKVLNLPLLRAAFNAYEVEHSRAGLSLLPRQAATQSAPEAIDLENLSDEEITQLKDQSLREYAKQR